MTHNEAHKILDRHKEGQHYSLITINYALQLTGDLPEKFKLVLEDGIKPRLESLCLASNSRIGQ
jgi:hypothetical protein